MKSPEVIFITFILFPFQYMLHYLKSLENWFEPALWRRTPVAKTAWAILRDSYHGDMCLHYRATHMAVAIIYFTLQLHGLEVPCSQEGEKRWWEVSTGLNINLLARSGGALQPGGREAVVGGEYRAQH